MKKNIIINSNISITCETYKYQIGIYCGKELASHTISVKGRENLIEDLYSYVREKREKPITLKVESDDFGIVYPYFITKSTFTQTKNNKIVKEVETNFSLKSLSEDEENKIFESAVDNFKKLIDNNSSLNEIRDFFSSNATVLYYSSMHGYKIFSGISLESKFLIDYVVYWDSSIGPNYELIKLNMPEDKLFTETGAISPVLAQSIHEVQECFAWIMDNPVESRKYMRNLVTPKLKIIGGASNVMLM